MLAEEDLEDEDILEMVNAGLVDITVVDSYLADFWKQIFTEHPAIADGHAAHQRADRLGDPQGQPRAQEGAGRLRGEESHGHDHRLTSS